MVAKETPETDIGVFPITGEPDRRPDNLLGGLQIVARHFGRPDSTAVLTAGLPLEDGYLTLELAARSARRIGLNCAITWEKPRRFLTSNLPAIVFLDGEETAVILRATGDNSFVASFPSSGQSREITLKEIEKASSGFALVFTPVYEAEDTELSADYAARLSQGHWLWSVLRRYWPSYFNVVLAAAIINIIALVSPLFVMNVYNRVLPNGAIATLWVLSIGVVLAIAFDFLLKTARASLIDRVGRRVDIQLASVLFEKILNTSLSARPASTGSFASRVSQYEFIREFFTSSTIALFTDILFVFVFLAVIWQLSGWLVIFPLAAFLIALIVGLILQALIGSRLSTAQNESSLRQGLLVEAISSIESVKALRAEGQLLRQWENYVRGSSVTAQQIKRLSSLGLTITQFAQQSVTVGIILGGTYRFTNGDISMGAIIAVMMLSSRTIAPLSQIAMTLTRARQATLAIRTLDEVMKLPDDRIATRSFVNRRIHDGSFEFRKVGFTYPTNDRKILDNISFSAQEGEKIGFIGKIGSGKTTIARLLTGLYLATEGEILIDGVDIRQYHPHEVRRSVGLVVQDSDLFRGSVKDNILIGNPLATDEQVVDAARLAGVEGFVSRHPMGYDMPCGERGSLLSGGQRQSIALARVLINNPKILILDEPSSSMDQASERMLLQHLQQAIRKDQTIILATHRSSMLALVDRLVVIDDGRIIANGPKDAVLKALAEKNSQRRSAPAN